MKERPILFSAEMVRALLTGTKTQTRRVVKQWQIPKQQEDGTWFAIAQRDPRYGFGVSGHTEQECANQLAQYGSPYGNPAAKLWVREAWMPDAPRDGTWPDVQFYGCKDSSLDLIPERYQKPKHCLFRATWNGYELVGWKPSIHMPRWACRILLQITDVRVERLQDISEADAVAEGGPVDHPNGTARGWFEQLWVELYGAGSWDANPWVWVIEFKKVEA
ncbi:hypothetical protein [Chromobacterium haemolyticum]|uniref:hypothetical protein n=1 Tax=Chromobacterium haemolyticum TaxID=394935 RepID=UPI00307D05E4